MSARRIARGALGVALFAVLGLALQVPVYQNYYVSLGYFAMAAWLYCFGTADGTIAGTLGVILYCTITGGMRGMPGWTLGNLAIGLILGPVFAYTKGLRNRERRRPVPAAAVYGIEIIAASAATALGILVVKSFTEVVLYAQPMTVRMATNAAAAVTDIVTLAIAVPVAVSLDRLLKKRFPALAEAK